MIPNKYEVIKTIEQKYSCVLRSVKGKRIMFEGFIKNQKLIVCTPQSKIHTNEKVNRSITDYTVTILKPISKFQVTEPESGIGSSRKMRGV
ncbi:hypothetical protein [Ureibacillus aquaedulcis]|uniref:Uncharacterized protein n=1 Tax=Ureibacillus aquaedulcis TaxID=3058421 RepID=A0ABT8GU30_9BACL|nr:hypothetical protein [Ureibacillus sp. BA0131]MDN4494729.1 hypothetical protein [Ureibacillus sp. BA0131]